MPLDSTNYTPAKPEAVRILEDARALIATPETWVQRTYQRNGHRCAIGAICWAAECSFYEAELDSQPIERAAREMGYENAVHLNDSTDHPTVMRMFDRAIELAWADAREAVDA